MLILFSENVFGFWIFRIFIKIFTFLQRMDNFLLSYDMIILFLESYPVSGFFPEFSRNFPGIFPDFSRIFPGFFWTFIKSSNFFTEWIVFFTYYSMIFFPRNVPVSEFFRIFSKSLIFFCFLVYSAHEVGL